MNDGPRVARVRHEIKRRRLTVARVERLPPKMVRIVLGGEELRGFTSLGFDDHIKVFFPGSPAAATDGRSCSRWHSSSRNARFHAASFRCGEG